MFGFLKKSADYFILSKGIFHISLDGPLDENSFQEKVRSQHYSLFALALFPNSTEWVPLREGSWSFPDSPNVWVQGRYPKLSALCTGKLVKDEMDFYLQFAGSKLGPLATSSVSGVDDVNFRIYDLLLRGTDWKDWILVENKEWLLKLIKKGIVSARDSVEVKNITKREIPRDHERRTAKRHTVIEERLFQASNGDIHYRLKSP